MKKLILFLAIFTLLKPHQALAQSDEGKISSSRSTLSTPYDHQRSDIARKLRGIAIPSGEIWYWQKKMKTYFGDKRFDCIVVVKNNGSLVKAWISNTSGNNQVDKKGLDAIKMAAPFKALTKQVPSQEQTYLVTFPLADISRVNSDK